MTFDAPAVSFSAAVANPVAPKRVAWTADFGGRFELDRDVREICTKAARRFEELGCIVEEATPDFGPVDEVFMALRSQQFVVDRELQLEQHRDKIKPDIIWNTELGLKQTTSQLAWAERERAALYRRMVEFFQKYDLLVTPSAPTAAFDVNLRAPADHQRQEARQLHVGLDAQLGDHRDRQPRRRGALRLRPVRPPGRPAARRQAARRGGPAAGRVAVRKPGRPLEAPAHRPQAGDRAAVILKVCRLNRVSLRERGSPEPLMGGGN